MDDKAVCIHRTSWKYHLRWCRDIGRRTPATRPAPLPSTPPPGAWLPCRPPHPGGPAPLPPTVPPEGPAPLPSGRQSPTGLPVPLQGLLPPCPGGRGVTRPGLCRSSCPFPTLFPRLPLLRGFACLLPIPGWSCRPGPPSAHSLMGSNPGPPRSIFPQKTVSRCYSALAMSNQDNEPGRKNQTAVGADGDGKSIDINVSFHHALLRHEERRISTHTLTAHLLGELKTTRGCASLFLSTQGPSAPPPTTGDVHSSLPGFRNASPLRRVSG